MRSEPEAVGLGSSGDDLELTCGKTSDPGAAPPFFRAHFRIEIDWFAATAVSGLQIVVTYPDQPGIQQTNDAFYHRNLVA